MKSYHPLLAVGTDDCRVEEIKGDSWKLRYEFWKRVTPRVRAGIRARHGIRFPPFRIHQGISTAYGDG